MDTISSIILGTVQGLTEFLPISSSGHLVLFQNLLGFKEPELLLDCSLHLGTLLAVCIYLRSDLKSILMETKKFTTGFFQIRGTKKSLRENPHAYLALMVFFGTLPTLLAGLFFRSAIENLFGSLSTVGIMLVVTGLILAITKLIPEEHCRREEVAILVALAIGAAQGLALIPGISRSGATIVCALVCGLRRELAARFSFLLAMPAIIGATLVQLDAEAIGSVGVLSLTSGFVSAALVGLIALKILMGMVRKGKLFWFAPYCWALGLFILLT
jgi:undecaprenyl-diphosphatase